MQPPVRKSRGKGKGQMDDDVLVKFPDKINHKKSKTQSSEWEILASTNS